MQFRYYIIELTTHKVTGTNSISAAMEHAASDNHKVIDAEIGAIRKWPDFPITIMDVYDAKI